MARISGPVVLGVALLVAAGPAAVRDARAQAAFTVRGSWRDFGLSMTPLPGRFAVGSPVTGFGEGRLDAFDLTTGAVSFSVTPFLSDRLFARSLATLGTNVVAGAPGPGFLYKGDVQVIDGTSGSTLLTATDPMGVSGDRFGFAVAVLGGNIVVGAPGLPMNIGNAHLVDGTTGAIIRTFANPSPASDDFFGWHVAVLGPNVLVGAPGDDTAATDAGAAYLFDGATGALLQSFFRPAPGAGEFFGFSVAVVGGNALIGAPDTAAGGSAELYDPGTGALVRTFANPTPAANDDFGFALAAYGSNVLVGAPGDAAVYEGGAAYLFDGGTGALLRTLKPPRRGTSNFGWSLAEADGRIAVGDPADSSSYDGHAHLFCGGAAGCGPCETCGPGGSCVSAPNPTCRLPISRGAGLRIIDQPGTADHVAWRWRRRGFSHTPSGGPDFGDPTAVHDYTLCVFEGGGTLRFSAALPAGGVCNGNPCWTAVNEDTYVYLDPDASPDGVVSALLDAPGRIRLRVKASGPLLSGRPNGLPALPLTPPVRAQLQASDGLCWEGVFSAPGKNTDARFIGRSD
jgi:hypothetical protein